MGLLPRRPRNRRIAVAGYSLTAAGLTIGGLLWLGGIYNTTPATSPTPSEVTSTQSERAPERSTTPPPATPPAQDEPPALLRLTGVVTGTCLPETLPGARCDINSAVYTDADGRVQLQQGGSQYLLVTCGTAECNATSVTKFEVPCVRAGAGNSVFCATVDGERRDQYQGLVAQASSNRCEVASNRMIACTAMQTTSVDNGQLFVNGQPAEAAIVGGEVGIYAVAAPLGVETIRAMGHCTLNGNTFRCSPGMQSFVYCDFVDTGAQSEADIRLHCASPSGEVLSAGTFYCPPGHGGRCSLQRTEIYRHPVHCPSAGKILVCRKGDA